MKTKNTSIVLSVVSLILGVASPLHAESKGTWTCKLDGGEWKNEAGGASLNGGMLTLYSGDDRIDGIYIMTGKPAAVEKYALNTDAQASFSDTTGKNHKSKAGSGTLEISKYAAPEGEVLGKVEGTFSGSFDAGASKELALKDCAFNLPVKNL